MSFCIDWSKKSSYKSLILLSFLANFGPLWAKEEHFAPKKYFLEYLPFCLKIETRIEAVKSIRLVSPNCNLYLIKLQFPVHPNTTCYANDRWQKLYLDAPNRVVGCAKNATWMRSKLDRAGVVLNFTAYLYFLRSTKHLNDNNNKNDHL